MSFLDKIFGSNNESHAGLSNFWKEIHSESDIEEAAKLSHESKVVIFKHSTGCYISKTVLKNFESEVRNNPGDDLKYYYLDLLAHRNLSNLIAEKFGVVHQSPQIIVLKDGKAVADASHQDISLSLVCFNS